MGGRLPDPTLFLAASCGCLGSRMGPWAESRCAQQLTVSWVWAWLCTPLPFAGGGGGDVAHRGASPGTRRETQGAGRRMDFGMRVRYHT